MLIFTREREREGTNQPFSLDREEVFEYVVGGPAERSVTGTPRTSSSVVVTVSVSVSMCLYAVLLSRRKVVLGALRVLCDGLAVLQVV